MKSAKDLIILFRYVHSQEPTLPDHVMEDFIRCVQANAIREAAKFAEEGCCAPRTVAVIRNLANRTEKGKR